MKVFHTSPQKIETITRFGTFGDCLFFSADVYVMTASGSHVVYSLELDDSKVISASKLYDEAIVSEIAALFDCDEEQAESLLDASESEWDFDCDADKSWKLQALRGECAKKMGFDACEDEDEQGTVYIVPMSGREADLIETK
ncbi:hypothetical protein [Enterovibrio norvegicus]|uniref:hypothetical protein n=1 Tax=Enterovibrio norvegicus TaxID=188144 RepID=UPI000C82F4F6|nr:hypothetical protein [Enterovibrio norvegicus]PMN73136.1 hypothetical protein BCT27_12385 [Enterovibrio norvegicus]